MGVQEAGMTKCDGVRDHSEGYDVCVGLEERSQREVIIALNEGGYNCTFVDLLDIVDWVKANRPELLKET